MESVGKLWDDALALIQRVGWTTAESEIKRRISGMRASGVVPETLELNILVLATLQQKFGNLDSSAKYLAIISKSRDKKLAKDATVRLGKVLSQKGEFGSSLHMLLDLFPSKNSQHRLSQPEGVSGSVLWRMGFLSGMEGDSKSSKYWFERHLDFSARHGSQYANNSVFQNLVKISRTDFDFNESFSKNQIGIQYYLQDTLNVKEVKYVNVSKSIVVPLIMDGVVLLVMKNYNSAILQFMLCRRLIQLEGLTFESEGIAEAIYSLKCSNDQVIQHFAIAFCSAGLNFDVWAEGILGDKRLFRHLVGEREDIFKYYFNSRDYSYLSVGKSLPYRRYSVSNHKGKFMNKDKKVFLIHGHDELNLLKLEKYLTDKLNVPPVILKDNPSQGKTIIEKFELFASDCNYAIAIFTKDDLVDKNGDQYLQPRPNVIFELGWFYGNLGRENVLIVFQEGVNVPSDLDGIIRIQFEKNILDKAHEIIKEIES